MKILVLVQDYPSSRSEYALSYVHTRCLGYKKKGHHVDVLNFSAKSGYSYEGISVIREEDADWRAYDKIVSHAPNLKNHVRYLNKATKAKIAFFFHGHEVLRRSEYPAPYEWKRRGVLEDFVVKAYDIFKLTVLKRWLKKKASTNDVGLVFVSNWMRERFEVNMGVSVEKHWTSTVIPNAAHESFIKNSYRPVDKLAANFVTIRPLDESKYCVDLVVKLAKQNPERSFHIFGRGAFFSHNPLPSNVVWFDRFIAQNQIPELLNNYACALMPTRFDAQGVMMCEMAVYGIPLATTDFSVCKEMLDEFENCMCADFEGDSVMAKIDGLRPSNSKNDKFDLDRLIERELEFLNAI